MGDVGQRYFYLDDYSDELVPCEPSLLGWAAWLAAPDEFEADELPAKDGQVFEGSALLFRDDIVATRVEGQWRLSRDPDDEDFLAVRFGEGGGWTADEIVNATREDLLEFLEEYDEHDESIVYVAAASSEQWSFTFRAGDPPRLDAERVQ